MYSSMEKFALKNVETKNEQQEEQPETKPLDIVRGFHQYINFGKYKGKTFYDIANEGDWKYLIWCDRAATQNNMKPLDNGFRFKIDESCKSHIHAALRSKGPSPVNWIKYDEPLDSKEETFKIYYQCDSLKGPAVIYQRCSMCRRRKNISLITKHGKSRLCMVCEKEILPQK